MVRKLLGFEIENLKKDGVIIEEVNSNDIAIIGMAVRLPKSRNINEFWDNIAKGTDCVGKVPDSRKADIEKYLKYSGMNNARYLELAFLDEIDKFDYEFFDISPTEAKLMDVNHRLFLETVWEAIEDAGYAGERIMSSRTGVYVGFGGESNYKKLVYEIETDSLAIAHIGNLNAALAGRISHLLDLRGPSVLIDTACSSSLVAVHYACQGIKNGECDMAIAGGIHIVLLPIENPDKLGIESPDFRTRAFDDNANGTGEGEGVCAILLKPLSKAIDDRDNIYAVIKGSAINHDGRSAGLTAPNPDAQEDVIVRAWENAGINPLDISYIEAHGTGTKLGDPIEISSLNKAFRRYTDKKHFCAIGSVKSNIGHLIHCAGLAGLIKSVMALKNKKIPPSIHFKTPNRKIDFENSCVYVCDTLKEWSCENSKRICGVSSFGLSGTNCHVVLEEAPQYIQYMHDNSAGDMQYVFTLSAKDRDVLQKLIERYKEFFENESSLDIRNICYTSCTGRGHYNHRIALIVNSLQDLKALLKQISQNGFEKSNNDKVYYGKHKLVNESYLNINENCITAAQLSDLTDTANQKLHDYVNEPGNSSLIEEICNLYVRGANVAWEILYSKAKAYKVSLPTYPFKRIRCWLDIPNIEPDDDGINNLFYKVDWKREFLYGTKDSTHESMLVIKRKGKTADEILDELKSNCIDIYEANVSCNKYEQIASHKYLISNTVEDYERLFIDAFEKGITKIVYMLALDRPCCFDEDRPLELLQDEMVTSLLMITKALYNVRLQKQINLIILTKYVYMITGNEKAIYPDNAPLLGIGMALSMESNKINVYCIDIDDETSSSQISDEIACSRQAGLVAYRDNVRYIRSIVEADLIHMDKNEAVFRKDGVYLITGGTGGIGLEIASYITGKNQVKLVLVSRTGLPDENLWDDILAKKDHRELCEKIKKIRQIRNSGSTVECYAADVADYGQMSAVLQDVRRKYGYINGVIHCAGIPGGGFLRSREYSEIKKVLRPKVQGTWILDNLTRDDDLDFFILFSSFKSIAVQAGQADYAASNLFLDSYSEYRNKLGKNTTVINWSAWRDTGMASAYSPPSSKEVFERLSTSTALKAFEEITARNVKSVIVGKINMEDTSWYADKNPYISISASLKQKIERAYNNDINTRKADNESHFKDVILEIENLEGDVNSEEKLIANVWGKVLGLEKINIDDNFFELGGNSLLTVKLETEMEQIGLDIKEDDIYKYPTIRKLAEYLRSEKSKPVIIDNIEPFNDIFYKNCFYNALFAVLNHFSRKIESFIVNDIIAYSLNYADGASIIDAEFIPVLKDDELLAQLGLHVKTKRFCENIIKDIERAIDYQRPVIIWVDCFYESIREDTYQKEHLPHTWLIYGYDSKKELLYIIEQTNKDNLNYKKKTISFTDAINSYKGYINNFMDEKVEATFYEFSDNSKGSQDILDQIEYQQIVFLHNNAANKKRILSGLDMLNTFSKEFKQVANCKNTFLGYADKLIHGLNNVINAKRCELYRLKSLYKGGPREDLIILLSDILDKWKFIRRTTAKFAYSGIYNNVDINSCVESIDEILDMEKKYCNELLSLIEKIN